MNRHHRRSIRLRNYDYTQCGAYFVTICTEKRRCIFGQVVGGEMVVNEWGQIVAEEWEQTAIIRPNVELDAFVVMPNHVHAIIVIADDGRGITPGGTGMMHHAPTNPPTEYITPTIREFSKPIPNSLPTIIGAFKAAITRRINRLPNPPDYAIWQRNYYEHIIRNEISLNHIRAYIANNAAKWAADSLYTE